MVSKRVVSPAGQIRRYSLTQGRAGGAERAADHGKGAPHQLRRPREADAEHRLALQGPVDKRVYVRWRMNTQHVVQSRSLGLAHLVLRERSLGEEARRHQAILIHRVGVVPQRYGVAGRSKSAHG